MAYDPATNRWHGDPDRVAIVLPGGGYTPDMPLLYYATAVLAKHGWTVQELRWQPPADRFSMDRTAWVLAQAEPVLAAETAPRRLLVGKSLGTFAAPLAVALGLPAIWLTPILSEPDIAAALAATTAATLLIGGGADASWEPEVAARLSAQQLVLPGADHALEHPDDPLTSVRDLARVTARMDEFLSTL
ncbi:alpha/beta hydrolase [Catellatospora sp. KI3]|uniref:alpha/beta hydrolase n=1 Tax=Catellatospora sp. KI3 TaxID=3041620 RepID=UPI002482A21C|nr:alpha/beta hydrolase [Catellatospora sp. KI3]MDI1465649.1 alpha/beta hydrolase [Catellatospora sp. KI3]